MVDWSDYVSLACTLFGMVTKVNNALKFQLDHCLITYPYNIFKFCSLKVLKRTKGLLRCRFLFRFDLNFINLSFRTELF